MLAAMLDTSVLWPSRQRDFLLSLAVEGLYRPLWSTVIMEELEYHQTRKLRRRGVAGDVAAQQARRLIDQMRLVFNDAMVVGWESLEGSFNLPDPDDEHVVAAAVLGGAAAIVTHNLRDFPRAKVPAHIDVVSPTVFAADIVSVSPDLALRAVTAMAARYRSPERSVDEVLDELATRHAMDEAVETIRAVM
ncbi:PIN domain-containing protein [Mycobacterium simiae]|uniref:PIN domain-containing protein n=1 Tax=Mycobacterium simiae TaxID=1784 RepID=A0A5B1BSQ9_MYCSI|nr:PIN domain-containing protein [Mycobacterium simiae]KAA1251717.1 PIN domain-containing protein [Mycobacterium simiae]